MACAAGRGSIQSLKVLLKEGANVALLDLSLGTALHHASRNDNLAVVELLLEAGSDANAADNLGNTPLIDAVLNKCPDCAKALLPFSDTRKVNKIGCAAFHVSVITASTECFEVLLPVMAADVDMRTVAGGVDKRGVPVERFQETALMFACERGLQPMAVALIKHGASRMARDNCGWTPLHWATVGEALSCVILLVGRPGKVKMTPAEVDAVTEKGKTALHLAAERGHEKICGVLLQAGARLDAKAHDGGSPLDYARLFQPTNQALHALLSGRGPGNLPGTVCDHCGKTPEQASVAKLLECGSCRATRYCGKACSAAAWPGHKKACRARKAAREADTKPSITPWEEIA